MQEMHDLCIYWGKSTLHCLSLSGTEIKKFFTISLPAPQTSQPPPAAQGQQGSPPSQPQQPQFQSPAEQLPGTGAGAADATLSGQNMNIIQTIQSSLMQQEIDPPSVHAQIALSSHEVIFRTFIIPWMQSSEIKSAVQFEAAKYVPFPLENLSYTFKHTAIKEGEARKYRVIFAAIKKDALEKYTNMLDQMNLNYSVIEPAPISLIRTLNQKQILPADEAIAVIEKDESGGKILIVYQHFPVFVREFQLQSVGEGPSETGSPQDHFTRLVNEIRISLNYYHRQESHLDITKIYLVTNQVDEGYKQKLEADLEMPVVMHSGASILESDEIDDNRYLNAYGVGLVGTVEDSPDFNLSGKSVPQRSSRSLKSIKKAFSVKTVAVTVTICALIIAGTLAMSQQIVSKPRARVKELNEKLGAYKGAKAGTLKKQNEETSAKLQYLRNLRFESNVHEFLKEIPEILPPGTWVKTLNVTFTDDINQKKSGRKKQDGGSKMRLSVNGYAYHENTRDQFGLVTALLNQVKQNALFKESFENIDISSVKVERLGDFTVTSFNLECE